PRIGASVTFYGLAVLRQFEMQGVFPLNESVAIGRSRDKLRSTQLLARDGIGLPVTTFAHDPKQTEEVLKLAEARDEGIIAVINADGVLLGVIAPRELTEIARREAEEDMLLMSGVSPDSTAFDSPVQILRRRLPWLATGLIGSAVAAMVIGGFEETLAAAAILASFIPVVMATAGNAGMQAASVSLQEIASVPED
ncbi:MAG: hypothetical protein AAFY02_22390, partial [Pseudomonadota bacterium]